MSVGTTVGKFSNKGKKAQILRVKNKKGQSRYLAVSGKQLLSNKVFVRKYSANNVVRKYLHSK